MGERLYSSIPSDALKELDAFCKEFLSCTCCEDHEVATKLAKLSLFLCFREDKPGYYPEDNMNWFRERFSRLCADTDPRLIIPATPIDFRFLSKRHDHSASYIERPNVNFDKNNDDDPWWHAKRLRYGYHGYPLEFEVGFQPGMSIALAWIEPKDVNRYLGFILEDKMMISESY